MRFPLGELTKPEVRELAAAAGLPVASKADSQDLCFLAGTDRARFLARHGGVGDAAGAIVDRDGNVVGGHDGQHRFTVGQRRGIGIAAAGAAVRDRQGRATATRSSSVPGRRSPPRAFACAPRVSIAPAPASTG